MKIFETNRNINKNAYLNWNTDKHDTAHNFYVLAKDFEEAAITLMKAVLENNIDKKADSLIMPIFYCIDQSIEVYLKAIIQLRNYALNIQEKIYDKHNIRTLFGRMRDKLDSKESIDDFEKCFKALSSYIEELYKYIKPTENSKLNMDFARYPVDIEGNPHFYIESSDNVVVNVEELHKRFTAIASSLEGIYSMYREEMEHNNGQTNI